MSLDAPHIGFVIAAYGISALVLILLVLGTVSAFRRKTRQLEQLEMRKNKNSNAGIGAPSGKP